jgi:crotonyl-CoA reductase
VNEVLSAILSAEAGAADFAALPLPESYRAITVHKDETEMFTGLDRADKDPRKSLHLDEGALSPKSGHLFVSLCGECDGS